MNSNRKTATELLLIQWARFQNVSMKLEGSTLFTGVNGSGKSTILDAMTYLLTGNTQFNKAAKDRDRTVLAYVRGDTKSNGSSRYLRSGEVVSYIAMEFFSPAEQSHFVVGVCMESPGETSQPKSSWFVCRNTRLEEINFSRVEDKMLVITPKNQLCVRGEKLKAADFFSRDRGIEQVMRALGLRCDVKKYRSKLLKMMAFHPENNIDQFIQDCVLEAKPVESLQELRQQRQQFEQLRLIYENLKNSKKKLDEIERKTIDYEKRSKKLHTREMMYAYQQLKESQAAGEDLERRLLSCRHRKESLSRQKEDMEIQLESALKRYQIAENNDVIRGMNDSIQALEQQKKKKEADHAHCESQLAQLKKLERQVQSLMEWLGDLSQKEKEILLHISEAAVQESEKLEVFLRFQKLVRSREELLESQRVHSQDRAGEIQEELLEINARIRDLESNIMRFPKEVEKARETILHEFQRQKIDTPVRTFAELVREVTDPAWRDAVETFLGKKRYYLIVDGKYCHQAMEILQKKNIHKANVVITDKLPEEEIVKGSAAEILDIPNVFARRYANYLLNGIHLCDSLEELHEYPKGGLMRDGMLAKSYAVANMDMKKTQCCLGQDAVSLLLEQAKKQREELLLALEKNRKDFRLANERKKEIGTVDLQENHYDFAAGQRLAGLQEELRNIEEQLKKLQGNPDFVTMLEEREQAKAAYEGIRQKNERLAAEIKSCEDEAKSCLENQKELSVQLRLQEKAYEESSLQYLELKPAMEEEYEQLCKKKESFRVLTAKAIQNVQAEVSEAVKQLENSQLEYCRMSDLDLQKRGVAFIPFYREEYRNLSNIKMDEAHEKLIRQAKKLESAFMNDFVAEINEAVRDARGEIADINRELRKIPFGNDTYKFVMEPKADRAVFFRICEKMEAYMDNPEIYMNSGREDEELEKDIQGFIEMILEEEDETEYTDYRKYFTYDMKILSRQGGREVESDLSKKQGSASNGEKQTPYFIILAASLLQCYPKDSLCARLAFIDEAFSALSRERIEQMVKYLEENHFQVIYAAPPEKINSIGSFIRSTVSLIMTGRYTNAVEGLVK